MNPKLSSVFKSYDIRGLADGELTPAFAWNLGLAICAFYNPKRVMLGHDMRLTSPLLHDALAGALAFKNVEVVSIGLCSTPLFNISLGLAPQKYDLGVMITASHNPGIYNGFKLTLGDCRPVGLGSGLECVRDVFLKFDEPVEIIPATKIIQDHTAMSRYLDRVLQLADIRSDISAFEFAVDAGNGMSGVVVPELLERLPQFKVHRLFFEPDGNFPNHEANPLKEETLEKLKETVLKNHLPLGVAFDGDADRIGFVDENGEQIPGDILTALLSSMMLKRHRGASAVYDVRSSWSVPQSIVEEGGRPIVSEVGHANIKRRMRDTGAVFAGELSMHFYYRDFWNLESGDFTMLLIIKELIVSGKKLSELWKPFLRYHKIAELNLKVDNQTAVINRLKKLFINQASSVTEIDGLRCDFGDPLHNPDAWWFNIRQSNTEPLVRLNLEAVRREVMEQKTKELTNLITGS